MADDMLRICLFFEMLQTVVTANESLSTLKIFRLFALKMLL